MIVPAGFKDIVRQVSGIGSVVAGGGVWDQAETRAVSVSGSRSDMSASQSPSGDRDYLILYERLDCLTWPTQAPRTLDWDANLYPSKLWTALRSL